jgi:hypothetical protein
MKKLKMNLILKSQYKNSSITIKKTNTSSITFNLWNADKRTLNYLYNLGYIHLFEEVDINIQPIENNSTQGEISLYEDEIQSKKDCNCKNKTNRKKK